MKTSKFMKMLSKNKLPISICGAILLTVGVGLGVVYAYPNIEEAMPDGSVANVQEKSNEQQLATSEEQAPEIMPEGAQQSNANSGSTGGGSTPSPAPSHVHQWMYELTPIYDVYETRYQCQGCAGFVSGPTAVCPNGCHSPIHAVQVLVQKGGWYEINYAHCSCGAVDYSRHGQRYP